MFRRKAVSPIVATVLLIIIAVAAGVLIWVWLHGFAEKNPTAQPTLQEEFKIDSVSVSGNVVTIYVRNIGQVGDTVSSAYILDAVSGNTVCSNTSVGVTVDVDQVKPVIVNCTASGYTLQSGHAYIAKIVTDRGVEATYQFIAP